MVICQLVIKIDNNNPVELVDLTKSLFSLASQFSNYVEKNGNKWLAKGYINYLYSPIGQEMAAKYFYRPRNAAILEKYKAEFPPLQTFTIDEVFGGWAKAQQTHFVNGAIYDQISNNRK